MREDTSKRRMYSANVHSDPLQGPLRGPAQRIPPRKQEPERAAHHTAGCSSPPPPKKKKELNIFLTQSSIQDVEGQLAGAKEEVRGAQGLKEELNSQLASAKTKQTSLEAEVSR